MKLIVCSALPTSRIFGEKVDAWWYAANGFDVEFWDLAPLFIAREKLEGFYSGSENYRYQGPKHRVLSDPEEFAKAVRAHAAALFWYLSRFDRMLDDDRLIDLFNQHQVRYVFQHFDPHEPAKAWLERVKQPLRDFRQRWYARICRPVAVVTSGTVGRKQVEARYPSSRVISIPSVKVLWEDRKPPVQAPYTVFVDESIAFDPDFQLHGHVLCTDVDAYYRRMRDLFRRVEDCLQMPVKIGCSGKYRYPDVTSYFGEREVIYGDTLRLVQGCTLAFGHLSLALDQAIVSRKPVVLVDDVSFTPWRRMGFRDVIRRFRQHPVRNTEIGKDLLQEALARELAFYGAVENKYFREPAVQGHYRQICADVFRTIAA